MSLNVDTIISNWSTFTSPGGIGFHQMADEIESLATKIKKNDRNIDIQEIAEKIRSQGISNPDAVLQLQENMYSTSIADRELATAIANLGQALLKAAPDEAKETGKLLLDLFPPSPPPLPWEIHLRITSYLSTQEHKVLSMASHGEKNLLVQNIDWHIETINHRKLPLTAFPFFSGKEAFQYFGEHGKALTYLNLSNMEITDETFKELMETFPNVTHLIFTHINSTITDTAIASLRGRSLTYVDLSFCDQLTDAAFIHFEGMPLTHVNFSYCELLTDASLAYLMGMRLTHVDFSYCELLTDASLAYLERMPLAYVNFRNCRQLTDDALAHLKGMPISYIDLSGCPLLTDEAIQAFEAESGAKVVRY